MGRSAKFFILTVTFFLMLVQSAWALDGKKLYTEKFCITCHGKQGVSVAPNYPNLAGQNLEYMKNQVADIIAGKRKTKLTLLMTSNPVVMNITPEETSAIAEYLTTMK
ncbi:c-type cytochrome [bacterium]|nr:c-type cytochrome [bacterium]